MAGSELFKRDVAPRNRTIFLDEDDMAKYSSLSRVEELEPDSFFESLNRIYVGDCIEGLKRIPDSSVDFIFADPPYYGQYKWFGDNSTAWGSLGEYLDWCGLWLKECKRVLTRQGSLYLCCVWEYSAHMIPLLEKYFHVLNRITWKRDKGRGARRNWKNNMEDIYFCVKNRAEYIFNLDDVKIEKKVLAPYTDESGRPKDWWESPAGKVRRTCPSNIWTDLAVPFWSMRENTPHPTQKPEALVERCMLASSNRGSICLDPFMGSGTTAVVAERLKRRYIGFETYENYVRLALKRLDILRGSEPGD